MSERNATLIDLDLGEDDRPFSPGHPAVLAFYDGPQVILLASQQHGSFLALALDHSEGKWPFVLGPISSAQAAAICETITLGAEPPTRPGFAQALRLHFKEAPRAYILRDYGAQDLVAELIEGTLPAGWLPGEAR